MDNDGLPNPSPFLMAAPVIMVQGTASSVGKSLVAAALCRLFARRGLRVAPYKSQNMSNNAAAVTGGGEIGRAQALQAIAAGTEASVDMNPVLLKPEADARSQVVVLGRPWKTLGAFDYYLEKDYLWGVARAALDRLRGSFDLVVAEGAGSPAEINLRGLDFANMEVARHAAASVILVADIDSGGVFAQIFGTLGLLEPAERALVSGIVINKFRGDPAILAPGIRQIEGLTGVPVLGVLPWIEDIGLAEEDGSVLERGVPKLRHTGAAGIDIAVIAFPRISNFDDLDPLRLEEGVSVRFVREAAELGNPDALILPGSKATLADLEWLRERSLDQGLLWLARAGKSVVGLCGGFQMLGEWIEDGAGIEGAPRSLPGLGLLPVSTTFGREKTAFPRSGRVLGGPGFFAASAGAEISGYEIHSGLTRLRGRGIFELEKAGVLPAREDGATSGDGRIWGSYLHGLFGLPDFRRAWLASLGARPRDGGSSLAVEREAALDRLADVLGSSLDLGALYNFAGIDGARQQASRNTAHITNPTEEP
jgi:adenosylcobyric acid synthase